MAKGRPHLIFVSGPQTGRRVRLRSRPMEAGRLPSSDIQLSEDYASRSHMRFRRRGEEWTVENLSANGTRINGRNYREGRQIILGTGDVLGVGSETSILYVGPGDDPDDVLAQWREDHEMDAAAQAAEQQAEPVEPTASEAPADDTGELPLTGRLPTDGGPVTAAAEPEPTADQQEAEAGAKREKRRKYLIFGVFYAVGFIVLLVVLGTLRGRGDGDTPGGAPAALSEQQIVNAVESPLRRQANPARAAEMLQKAELHYRDRRLLEGNLYKAVKCFKLHLAYSGRSDFEELQHSRMYRDAMLELTGKVHEQYEQAYRLERNGDWDAAEEAFRKLQRIYPAAGDPEPRTTDPSMNPQGPVWRNIMSHLSYI
ncbi:MAG: FHA domain-containing protein, partial [Phycisphaerae bacterium]